MMNFCHVTITWLWEMSQFWQYYWYLSQYHCNGYFLINQNRSRRRCHDNKSNFGRIHPKYNSSFSTLDDQKSLTKYLFHTMLQQNSKLLIKMVTRYIILYKQIHVAVGKNQFFFRRFSQKRQINWLHRYWWPMLVIKCVGDKFGILGTSHFIKIKGSAPR